MPAQFFSVVIPALNEERHILHLLKDLQKQTFKDFSVIVVDGNSEDNTQKIVNDYAITKPFVSLVSTSIHHVSVQRNLGAKHATGKYLLFLDADGRIPPYFLEGIHYQLIKKEVDAFTCWAIPDTKNTNDRMLMKVLNIIFETGKKLDRPMLIGACVGCKKTVFAKIHGFNENLEYLEDLEFARKVKDAGYALEVFREPTYVYSLRRLRKEGTLKLIYQQLPIWISILKSKKITHTVGEYPMLGGNYFQEDDFKEKQPPVRAFLKEIEQGFVNIVKSKSTSLKESIRELLEEIL